MTYDNSVRKAPFVQNLNSAAFLTHRVVPKLQQVAPLPGQPMQKHNQTLAKFMSPNGAAARFSGQSVCVAYTCDLVGPQGNRSWTLRTEKYGAKCSGTPVEHDVHKSNLYGDLDATNVTRMEQNPFKLTGPNKTVIYVYCGVWYQNISSFNLQVQSISY